MTGFVLAIGLAAVQAQAPNNDFQFTDPGRNKLVWVQSPNYGKRPKDVVVDTIVLHHTASADLKGVVKWFSMPESEVSAHFTVGKDGSIVQHVSTFDRAWHAGGSVDKYGRQDLNNFSVGIEIVNLGDGKDPWTKEEVEAVHHLCRVMMRRFPIKQITSHAFVAIPKGRKVDPLGYPWDSLKDLGVELVP